MVPIQPDPVYKVGPLGVLIRTDRLYRFRGVKCIFTDKFFSTDPSKAVVTMLFIFVWLCSSLLLGIFTLIYVYIA